MREWFSAPPVVAGFITILVGYTSSAAIIYQAALTTGAAADWISSWFWALGIGMGVTTLVLSARYRQPITTAWSTPGAALLVTALSGVPIAEAVGAFLFASGLVVICGISGAFDKLLRYIPQSLAAAMLAGILLQFGLSAFNAIESASVLVGGMLLVYLVLRERVIRYVIPLTLVAGVVLASIQGLIKTEALLWQLTTPVWVAPEFSWSTLISIGLPLFVVTMVSQNMPGIAALRTHGYDAPASPLIATTGFAGFVLAPFGGFALNLSAITAAICMGEQAHADPTKRYMAAIWAGVFYLMLGMMGSTVVGLFDAFPQALVIAIAGLALLSTIGNSLSLALKNIDERESAIITFLVTASGVSLIGIGSAFWGIVIGLAAHYLSPSRAR